MLVTFSFLSHLSFECGTGNMSLDDSEDGIFITQSTFRNPNTNVTTQDASEAASFLMGELTYIDPEDPTTFPEVVEFLDFSEQHAANIVPDTHVQCVEKKTEILQDADVDKVCILKRCTHFAATCKFQLLFFVVLLCTLYIFSCSLGQ